MKRKRNNLDTLEANFIFSRVILETSKIKKFLDSNISERNKIIDEVCSEIITNKNKFKDDIEALKFELLSYKLNDTDKKNFYSSIYYDHDIFKPINFDSDLINKYDRTVNHIVSKHIF